MTMATKQASSAATLPEERNYAFRARLDVVHQPNLRVASRRPMVDEMVLDADWCITLAADASPFLFRAAEDLQNYLAVSMRLPAIIRRASVTRAARVAQRTIVLATAAQLPAAGRGLKVASSFRLTVADDRIVVCGFDERGVARGCHHLEDRMNLRRAPVLVRGGIVREPLFSPRMTHSGWGLDQFPDSHLNAIAHAGMDAILLFVRGVDQSSVGYCDINDLIRRAANYGLDVYLYSYMQSRKHPDDADAEAYYENCYGRLIASCPGARGIIFVGESIEFPSKDPKTNGRLHGDPVPPGSENDPRPCPGWWPCTDYPQWVELVTRVMRRHSPELDVVFWSYNWGWAPAEERLALIQRLPQDISLLVTFEMFETIDQSGLPTRCADYTLAFEGPGTYFRSEAEAAHARGLRLYAMANTGGLTWDFGDIPYEPFPGQWKRRWDAVLQARRAWGLSGLMESHHYGWFPSFISELAKEAYWTSGLDYRDHLRRIAERDFGLAGADDALAAWNVWSDAIRDYLPTDAHQYGPFRVGPSYPLAWNGEPACFPSAAYARNGAQIMHVSYRNNNQFDQAAWAHADILREQREIRILKRMERKLSVGLNALSRAAAHASASHAESARRMVLLGEFMMRATRTAIHAKSWFVCRRPLELPTSTVAEKRSALDQMVDLAKREGANAKATLPLVRQDSRLGWEPSMEYMCDPAHILWKLDQVRRVVDEAIPAFRRKLSAERKKNGK